MDDPQRIIMNISSDDEVGWGECRVTSGGGGDGVRDDGDWILELLNEGDRNTDDSDEVVVVREIFANPKQRVAKPAAKCVDDDGDDDECLILDGDPEKPVTIQNEGGGDNSDDLLVVSEKGQVACRDYPHPRHLCVKFPFNSTPHERHCEQCHCYVCDSLAPCVNWGSGISSIRHCHATDKDEFWKAERKRSRKSDIAPPSVSGLPDNSLSLGLPPLNQTPYLLNNTSHQNQGLLKQAPHQLRSIATNIGTPTVVRHSRSHQFRYDLRNKFQPHLVSEQLRSTNENFIPRIRKHNVPNAGTHSVSQCVSFKRIGTVGDVLTPNSFRNSSYRNTGGYQFSGNQSALSHWQDPRTKTTPASNSYQGPDQGNLCSPAADSLSNLSTQPSMGSGLLNCAASQPQISSQTYGSTVNALVPQPQVSSQIYLDSNFANFMPPLPEVGTQQKWGNHFGNEMPFQSQTSMLFEALSQDPVHPQPLVTSRGNISNSSESSLPSQPMVSVQPNISSAFENPLSCQFQVYGQPASVSNDGQNKFEQGNFARSVPLSSSADFDSNLDTSMSLSNQPFPVEQTQLESVIFREKPATATDSQLPQSSNPTRSDFQFDPWTLEDMSALNIPLSPGLDAFSPESTPADTGFLFDF